MRKKLFILITLLVFLNLIDVKAMPNTFNREELDNYGVKKNWNINSSNLDNVLRTPAVDSSLKVYDFSEVLTEEDIKTIQDRINDFIEKNNMDLVIVTYPLEYNNGNTSICSNEEYADQKIVEFNEEFASDFYDYNDFGMFIDNNNGILLFRNTELDPCFDAMFYDMYTFGDAQLYFSQSKYDSILDGIYDNLHKENYLDGFLEFIDLAEDMVERGVPSEYEDYYVDEEGYLQRNYTYHIPWGAMILISGIITIITMIILVKKNKMIVKATSAEKYLDKKSINITQKEDKFLTSHITKYTESHDGGGSSGGGHSSGGGRHG